MNVLDSLDEIRAAINVLEHPFYQRWTAGELSAGELRATRASTATPSSRSPTPPSAPPRRQDAGARRGLRATPPRSAPTWGSGTSSRAPSEARRRLPGGWRRHPCPHDARMRDGLDGRPEPARASRRAVRGRGRPAGLSATKLDGLTAHYGYAPEGPAAEYFALHAHRDVEHARQARVLIARLLDGVGTAASRRGE